MRRLKGEREAEGELGNRRDGKGVTGRLQGMRRRREDEIE